MFDDILGNNSIDMTEESEYIAILKSGGPTMKVIEIKNCDDVVCEWKNKDNKVCRHTFKYWTLDFYEKKNGVNYYGSI